MSQADMDWVECFYVWCNIYSFFVVSIFWVVVINILEILNQENYMEFIMAGGLIGSHFGI
jgi:hypothetical protein